MAPPEVITSERSRLAGSDGAEPLDPELAAVGFGRQAEVQERRWQLRLAIAMPALMILFALVHGFVSLKILDWHWDRMDALGAGDVARLMLRHHLYAILVLAALGLVTGLAAAYAIVRPILAIKQTFQNVTRGQLNLRAPFVAASPELGDLSRSFNSMISSLNESIAERDRYLIEGIVTGLMTLGPDERVTALNSTGARILGLESSMVVGRTVEALHDRLPSQYHPFWDYIIGPAHGDRTRMPDLIVLKKDREQISLLMAISVLRGAKGEVAGCIVNFREWAEIKSLKQQLSRTDRLAALGTFTMGLAHELRNPLTSIKGVVQLLRVDGSMPESARESLDLVVKDVNRIDRFISELHDFSNQSPTLPHMASLNHTLHSAAVQSRGLADQLHKGIDLIEDYGDCPPVRIEPDRLTQAFVNIIRNAYEAAEPGSQITLRTLCRTEGPEQFIMAYLHNTGSTIEAADRAKIFDPFFTTKDKGTGLGLAIAYQIITQQNATVNLSVSAQEVTFICKFKVEEPLPSLDPQELPPNEGSLSMAVKS